MDTTVGSLGSTGGSRPGSGYSNPTFSSTRRYNARFNDVDEGLLMQPVRWVLGDGRGAIRCDATSDAV